MALVSFAEVRAKQHAAAARCAAAMATAAAAAAAASKKDDLLKSMLEGAKEAIGRTFGFGIKGR